MSVFILPIIFGILLYFDKNTFYSKKERRIHLILAILALLLAIPTSYALNLDHVGASLSGLVSAFSR